MIELRLNQRNVWSKLIEEEYNIVLKNNIIGSITIEYSKNSKCHSKITGFIIYDELNQNKGYGTKALSKIIKKLPAKVPIDLKVWKTNSKARHIYEKMGFHTIDKNSNSNVYYMTKNNN